MPHLKINFRIGAFQRLRRAAKRSRAGIVLIIISGFSVPCNAQSHRFADMVLLNGKIYTEDAVHSIAQSLAVIRGKIAFVGDTDGAKALIGGRPTMGVKLGDRGHLRRAAP